MVEYGYIDDAVIEVSQASIRKLDELQTLYSNAKFNDYIRRQLAIGASQFEGARLAHLQKTILAKQMFLAENKLTIEPLDASVRQVENRMKRQFPAVSWRSSGTRLMAVITYLPDWRGQR